LADEALSDQEIIDSCVICPVCDQAELDDDSVAEVIASSESVEDFFVKLDEAKKAARLLDEEVEARSIFHCHRRELDVRLMSNMKLHPGLVGQLVSRGATERGATAYIKSLEESMRDQASHIPPTVLARMLF
jgi:hypothetical protein